MKTVQSVKAHRLKNIAHRKVCRGVRAIHYSSSLRSMSFVQRFEPTILGTPSQLQVLSDSASNVVRKTAIDHFDMIWARKSHERYR